MFLLQRKCLFTNSVYSTRCKQNEIRQQKVLKYKWKQNDETVIVKLYQYITKYGMV